MYSNRKMQLPREPSVWCLRTIQIECRTGCATPQIAQPSFLHHTKSDSQSLHTQQHRDHCEFIFPLHIWAGDPAHEMLAWCPAKQCHTASAQPVNKHCSGWDHTRGQKQSPDLWRSKLKLYLLSYTSFCGRVEVPKGCYLQSITEIMKQNRFIPVEESGPYTFAVNKLQNLDIFHALPHTCKFIKLISLARFFLDGYPLTRALLDNCNPICCSCMTLAPVLEQSKLEAEVPSGSPPAKQPV